MSTRVHPRLLDSSHFIFFGNLQQLHQHQWLPTSLLLPLASSSLAWCTVSHRRVSTSVVVVCLFGVELNPNLLNRHRQTGLIISCWLTTGFAGLMNQEKRLEVSESKSRHVQNAPVHTNSWTRMSTCVFTCLYIVDIWLLISIYRSSGEVV